MLSPVRLLATPWDSSPPGSSVHGDFLGKNTGVGCHSLLQRIFLTQGLSPGLRHSRQILYHLSHQGSPTVIKEQQGIHSWTLVKNIWKNSYRQRKGNQTDKGKGRGTRVRVVQVIWKVERALVNFHICP